MAPQTIEASVVVRGTGSIGMRHLRVLSALGCDPIALPTRAGRSSAAELSAFRAVSSWDEAAARCPAGRPRGAIIATDTARHLADGEEALRHGFHVLVEKPLAAHGGGIAALRASAAESGFSVHVACNLRFSRGLSLVREHLPRLGRLYSVHAACQSYLPSWRPGTDHRVGYAARPEEGGVMRDLVHEIDYALWVAGAPREVYAVLGNSGELGIASEESADLLWAVEGGPVVSVRLDYLARTTRRSLTLVGSDAALSWNAVQQTVSLAPNGEPEVVLDARQERDDMMMAQAAAFLSVLGGGPPASLATLEEGWLAVRLMDAARRSHAEGRRVSLEGA